MKASRKTIYENIIKMEGTKEANKLINPSLYTRRCGVQVHIFWGIGGVGGRVCHLSGVTLNLVNAVAKRVDFKARKELVVKISKDPDPGNTRATAGVPAACCPRGPRPGNSLAQYRNLTFFVDLMSEKRRRTHTMAGCLATCWAALLDGGLLSLVAG